MLMLYEEIEDRKENGFWTTHILYGFLTVTYGSVHRNIVGIGRIMCYVGALTLSEFVMI